MTAQISLTLLADMHDTRTTIESLQALRRDLGRKSLDSFTMLIELPPNPTESANCQRLAEMSPTEVHTWVKGFTVEAHRQTMQKKFMAVRGLLRDFKERKIEAETLPIDAPNLSTFDSVFLLGCQELTKTDDSPETFLTARFLSLVYHQMLSITRDEHMASALKGRLDLLRRRGSGNHMICLLAGASHIAPVSDGVGDDVAKEIVGHTDIVGPSILLQKEALEFAKTIIFEDETGLVAWLESAPKPAKCSKEAIKQMSEFIMRTIELMYENATDGMARRVCSLAQEYDDLEINGTVPNRLKPREGVEPSTSSLRN